LEQAAAGGSNDRRTGPEGEAPLDIRNDAGEATVTLTRLRVSRIKRLGIFAGIRYGIGKGPGTLTVTEYGLTNSKTEALTGSQGVSIAPYTGGIKYKAL